MTNILQLCKGCSKLFAASKSEVRRGNGKYCTKICAYKNITKFKSKVVHEANLKCSWCSNSFYKRPSHMKNSRSGLYFCTRKCKDTAQRIGGIREIMPKHYGTAEGVNDYREKAFQYYQHECARCTYNKIEAILQVHHKDRNRTNNNLENLIILCPTCHMEDHYLAKDGYWHKAKH